MHYSAELAAALLPLCVGPAIFLVMGLVQLSDDWGVVRPVLYVSMVVPLGVFLLIALGFLRSFVVSPSGFRQRRREWSWSDVREVAPVHKTRGIRITMHDGSCLDADPMMRGYLNLRTAVRRHAADMPLALRGGL